MGNLRKSLFIWASVLIWLGRLTGLFDIIIRLIEPIVSALGMPAQAAPVFLSQELGRSFGGTVVR